MALDYEICQKNWKKTITIYKFSENLYDEIKSDENETDTRETEIPFQLWN